MSQVFVSQVFVSHVLVSFLLLRGEVRVMSVAMVPGREPTAADRLAAVEAHLSALAGMDAADRAGGDHLGLAHRMLRLRRQVEAVVASSLDAMACSGAWATAGGGRTASAWLVGSTTEAPAVLKSLLANGAFTRTQPALEHAAAAGQVSQAHVGIWRTERARYARIGVLLDAAAEHILGWARELTPRGFQAALVEFAHRLDPDLVDDVEAKKRRRVFLDVVATLDGYVHVNGLLDPITGTLFLQALESARRAGTTASDTDGADSTDGSGNDNTDSAGTDGSDGSGGTGNIDGNDNTDGTGTDAMVTTGTDGHANTTGDASTDRDGIDSGDPASGHPDSGGDPDAGDLVDAHADPARAGRSIAHRNVEALRRLLDAATAATGAAGLPAVNGTRPRIHLHIDADTLTGATSDTPGMGPGMGWLDRFGIPTAAITATLAATVACDATIAPLIVDRTGQIAAVLPGVRTIAPALRTAILTRDHHCRFPGCRARIDEIHHLIFYSAGGPTTRDNLVGLCYHHHQLIHTGGWRITGHPDGELRFTQHGHYTPDPTAPPSSPAGLQARTRRREAQHAARELLANPRINPGVKYRSRYALLDRERTQPPDPPF